MRSLSRAILSSLSLEAAPGETARRVGAPPAARPATHAPAAGGAAAVTRSDAVAGTLVATRRPPGEDLFVTVTSRAAEGGLRIAPAIGLPAFLVRYHITKRRVASERTDGRSA
ncbi:uncharacterized protein LOC125074856 [Vanessa atalanta]|uniref:uncharacterized protein LOC125074575 n=1 Tax=Vanessa atalanta TaxID=42275 RepID=UPI001FCCD3D9|nr:uncharacterized protein LOC125074575 [Vanessa atalanta]XP_047542267.1 uncharacterized protein LOC125074855 [Vanessa atalanta]XP_047542269.1 uncharacterized protein LOC125074856 [Vanessa atalanta]